MKYVIILEVVNFKKYYMNSTRTKKVEINIADFVFFSRTNEKFHFFFFAWLIINQGRDHSQTKLRS